MMVNGMRTRHTSYTYIAGLVFYLVGAFLVCFVVCFVGVRYRTLLLATQEYAG